MYQQNQWVVKLRARQQRLGETVDEYYDKLERLYWKANSTRRLELKEPVKIECPMTIQQALKKAKAAEAIYSREGP
ncbi:11902_t:CDS:2 [Gigaspora margarita]|uniref:11902_t:CDS:1 n=1 Tax=Gigaspora margarita TaxID=4874 RepID=A0ABN7UVZ8_GIGMA|nr:11902_t:CDS:2 [Gigaspora margarita]